MGKIPNAVSLSYSSAISTSVHVILYCSGWAWWHSDYCRVCWYELTRCDELKISYVKLRV